MNLRESSERIANFREEALGNGNEADYYWSHDLILVSNEVSYLGVEPVVLLSESTPRGLVLLFVASKYLFLLYHLGAVCDIRTY